VNAKRVSEEIDGQYVSLSKKWKFWLRLVLNLVYEKDDSSGGVVSIKMGENNLERPHRLFGLSI